MGLFSNSKSNSDSTSTTANSQTQQTTGSQTQFGDPNSVSTRGGVGTITGTDNERGMILPISVSAKKGGRSSVSLSLTDHDSVEKSFDLADNALDAIRQFSADSSEHIGNSVEAIGSAVANSSKSENEKLLKMMGIGAIAIVGVAFLPQILGAFK